MQDINIEQLKLKVNKTNRNDDKLTPNFEPSNDEGVLSKIYLDEKFSKLEGQISFIEKDYNEFILLSNKQSVEEVLIRRDSENDNTNTL